MVRMMWVFDGITCPFEEEPPGDPFDSGEVGIHDRPDNVDHLTLFTMLTLLPDVQVT